MAVKMATFERLYDMQYPRVYRYLLGRLRDHYAAEALAAEVFACAFSVFQRGTMPRRQTEAWLIEIADRMASRLRRRTSPEEPVGVDRRGAEDPEEVALRRLATRTRSGAADKSLRSHFLPAPREFWWGEDQC